MPLGWALSTLLFMCFDVWYLLRALLVTAIYQLWKNIKKKHLLEEVCLFGVCLSTDLDLYGHMNNGRYLRECDFGRYQLWLQNGVFSAVRSLNGAITLGGSTIRFRKSLQLFETYTIVSKVICWDDKAFYVDQRFVRKKDNFIMAVVLLKQTLKRISPNTVIKEIEGKEITSPPFPDYVNKWIEYNELSSSMLKKDN